MKRMNFSTTKIDFFKAPQFLHNRFRISRCQYSKLVQCHSDFTKQNRNSNMQNTIEQQLYNPATPYEKMLSNCVRSIFDFERCRDEHATLGWEDF